MKGQELIWAKSLSGDGTQSAVDIHIGKDNKVYVGGYFEGTCDFDPGPGVVNQTSVGTSAAFIAKYDTAGTLIWVNNIDSDSWDDGISIGVDKNSNVFVLGTYYCISDIDPGPGVVSLPVAGDCDLYLAKYNIGGNFLWGFPLSGAHWDTPTCLVVDANDNVIVSGAYMDSIDFDPGPVVDMRVSKGHRDLFVAKYDPLGNLVWANTEGGALDDHVTNLAIDSLGNIHACGAFKDSLDIDPGPGVVEIHSEGNYDVFWVVYDENGNYLRSGSVGGSSNEWGTNILPMGDGGFVMTGQFDGITDFDPGPGVDIHTVTGMYEDIFYTRFNALGELTFAKTWGGTGVDHVYGAGLDALGDVLLSGSFAATVDFNPGPDSATITTAGYTDIWVGKYSGTDGSLIWVDRLGGDASDWCNDLVMDGLGHYYITGSFRSVADFDPHSTGGILTAVDKDEAVFAKYGDRLLTGNTQGSFDQKLEVFPNPTSGVLVARANSQMTELKILSVMGEVLMSVAPNAEATSIDLSHFPDGIYFLEATTPGSRHTEKFMLHH